jgi:tetratricopeptide (TPR) repeat protein
MSSCIELASHALRVWSEDLIDLARNPLPKLLDDFRRIHGNFEEFKSRCYGNIDFNSYKYYESVFNVALLKLSAAIEDRVRGGEVKDEFVKFAVEMFTPDEKSAVRELERFSGLDVPPETLAEVIASRRGEVYELVKEAVSKQYVNLHSIVETWSRERKIGDSVRRGLIHKYEARFKNVIEAFKRLLEQRPAWLTRLFSEYEEALLSSAEVRSTFEKELKEAYMREAGALRERLEKLEHEREEFLSKLASLGEKAASREAEREVLERELNRLREECELLRGKYQEALAKWEERTKELEDLKGKLMEKERHLEEMAKREEGLTAAKEAYEAEIARLKGLVSEYEAKVKEYERRKEELQLELKSMEDKVDVLARSLRGELKGHLVTAEDAAMLELIFVGKLRSKLKEELPIAIEAPWGEVVVSKWSYERVSAEGLEQGANLPRNASIVFGHRSRGLLGLGEERVIEVRGVYLSHLDTLRRQGLDSQPATLSDLLNALRDSLGVYDGGGRRFTLIGIASPTGWDESVAKYVAGEKYSLVFSSAIVLLIDLIENKVIYPERLSSAIPLMDRYARIFMSEVRVDEEVHVEKVLKELCAEAIAKAPLGPALFPYRRLIERVSGISYLSMMRVLHRYKEKGLIEIKDVGGEKVVLCKSMEVVKQ